MSARAGDPRRGAGAFAAAIDSAGQVLERRPARVAVIGLVAAALAAALLWPHSGDGVLRLLAVALAGGYVVVRGFRALPPPLDDRHSPFSRDPLVEEPTESPMPLRRLEKLIEAEVDRPGSSPVIPGTIRLLIREEAERRLTDRRHLDLANVEHHPRILAEVRAITWDAIRLPTSASDPHNSLTAEPPRFIPLDRLDDILDDLERL